MIRMKAQKIYVKKKIKLILNMIKSRRYHGQKIQSLG